MTSITQGGTTVKSFTLYLSIHPVHPSFWTKEEKGSALKGRDEPVRYAKRPDESGTLGRR
jgi:hypothetical protein